METLHPSENENPKEIVPEKEALTPQGISAMQGTNETSPLPRSNNPETHEVSKTPEATPGKGDGNSSLQAPVSTNDSPQIQESATYTQTADILPPVSPQIPGYDVNATVQTETPGDWKDLGIVDVPVANLPDPDGVSSSDDFNHHISWEDARSATEQLPQIQKEVAAGKTGDDFSAEDQAAGRDYQQGRRRVYDLYYSNFDPVQLDKMGEQYSINSGRHRVFAAKALGLETLPARVKEKQG